MAKHTKTATGIAQIAFVTPKVPVDISLLTLVPYEALVKRVKVEYIKVSRTEADAAWTQSRKDFEATCIKRKRHLAAVKANATRKARKVKSEVSNGQT